MGGASGSSHSPFLLQGLVWCELCRRAMEPQVALGNSYYACTGSECPTVMVSARGLEDAVWQQYVLLFEADDHVVPTAMRWRMLTGRLRRLWVGADVWEVWGEWAPGPLSQTSDAAGHEGEQ